MDDDLLPIGRFARLTGISVGACPAGGQIIPFANAPTSGVAFSGFGGAAWDFGTDTLTLAFGVYTPWQTARSFGAPGGGLPAPGASPTGYHQHPAHVPSTGGGGKTLADIEMEYILQVYAKNNSNKQATAAELGISLKTLYNKLHKYEEELRMRAG